ncbi:enoyl-CoA hydratase/isomerase family protein [Rhizobium sp.]
MLKFERKGAVGVLTFAKAPVNAISFNDWLNVPKKLQELEQEEGLRGIVLIGEGKHFSAGNDHREFVVGGRQDLDKGTAAVRDGLKALAECPLITLAAVSGAAMGSALGLACMTDVRIGTPDAMLGLPEVKVGAFGGYRFIRDSFPDGEARKMQLTGEPISGERAYQLGFFQELVSKEDLLTRATALIEEMTKHLRPTFTRRVKRVFVGTDHQRMWYEYELERLRGVDYLEAGL